LGIEKSIDFHTVQQVRRAEDRIRIDSILRSHAIGRIPIDQKRIPL